MRCFGDGVSVTVYLPPHVRRDQADRAARWRWAIGRPRLLQMRRCPVRALGPRPGQSLRGADSVNRPHGRDEVALEQRVPIIGGSRIVSALASKATAFRACSASSLVRRRPAGVPQRRQTGRDQAPGSVLARQGTTRASCSSPASPWAYPSAPQAEPGRRGCLALIGGLGFDQRGRTRISPYHPSIG